MAEDTTRMWKNLILFGDFFFQVEEEESNRKGKMDKEVEEVERERFLEASPMIRLYIPDAKTTIPCMLDFGNSSSGFKMSSLTTSLF